MRRDRAAFVAQSVVFALVRTFPVLCALAPRSSNLRPLLGQRRGGFVAGQLAPDQAGQVPLIVG